MSAYISFLLLLIFSSSGIASDRPNIVLLVADDLGYGELGGQGNKDIPTPNIDSLARDGARFTDAYVTAPFCSASRAGFLTGRYQTRFGYEFNPIGARNEDPDAGLPVGEKTLGDILQEAGYATALIGKWHPGRRKGDPHRPHGADRHPPRVARRRLENPPPARRGLGAVQPG